MTFGDDARTTVPVRLGRNGSAGSPADQFPDDPELLQRWTHYASIMELAAGFDSDDFRETETSSTHDLAYRDLAETPFGLMLDPEVANDGARRGKLILEHFVRTLQDLANRPPAEIAGNVSALRPIQAWWLHLHSPRAKQSVAVDAFAIWVNSNRTNNRQISMAQTKQGRESRRRTYKAALWLGGLDNPSGYQPECKAGYRTIVKALDRAFEGLRCEARIDLEPDKDPLGLSHYLPSALARQLLAQAERQKEECEHRAAEGNPLNGYGPTGNTLLFEQAAPRLLPMLASTSRTSRSTLVVAPTSSGKTHLARIAMLAVMERLQKKVIILQPTKALVDENLRSWKKVIADSDRDWVVMAGSRDYPENDEHLRYGRFNVAILIPEKFQSLLAAGFPLGRVGLVVADELQGVNEGVRGKRLQMLLSMIRYTAPLLPILGLSASLSKKSVGQIQQWLDISPENTIYMTERPVPLFMHVLSHDVRMTHELGSSTPPKIREGIPPELSFDFGPTLDRVLGDYRRNQGSMFHYREALITALHILDKSPKARTLFFVGSRNDALLLSKIISDVLASSPRFRDHAEFQQYQAVIKEDTDLFSGRFAPDTEFDESDLDRVRAEFNLYPKTNSRKELLKFIRNGVGVHSRSLDAIEQRFMTELFTMGVVRLLICTDTLRVGMNLPADYVINGSLVTTGDGGTQILLDRDSSIQRLGRAGRLGKGSRGDGYIVVSNRSAPRVRWTEHEKSTFGPTADSLCDTDKVFDYYCLQASEGIPLTNTKMNEEVFAFTVLATLARLQRDFTEEEMWELIEWYLNTSLAAKTDSHLPTASAVLDILRKGRLVTEEDQTFRVTPLGASVSTAGLPLREAPSILAIANAAAAGAGKFTILFEAAKTTYLSSNSSWISADRIAKDNKDARVPLKEAIISFARLVVGLDEWDSNIHGPTEIKPWLPHRSDDRADALLGSGREAEALLALLVGDIEKVPTNVLTPLLRACVMTMWINACPVDTLKKYVETVTRISVPNARGGKSRVTQIKLHFSDVQQIGDSLAYLFSPITAMLGLKPLGTLAYRRVKDLTDEVAHGVPRVLVPIARLMRASTHRERIVYLRTVIESQDFDTLSDVVSYMREPRELPKGHRRPIFKLIGLPSDVREKLFTELRDEEDRMLAADRKLPAQLGTKEIAGIDSTLEELNQVLLQSDLPRRIDTLARLFHHVEVVVDDIEMFEDDENGDNEATFRLSAAGIEITCLVRTSALRARDVDKSIGDVDLIIAPGGLSAVAVDKMMSLNMRTTVLSPGVLLEAMHLLTPAGDSDSDGDIFDDLELPSLEDLNACVDEDDEDLDEPSERGTIGGELLATLLSLPPFLTRSDLELINEGRAYSNPNTDLTRI